MFLDELCNLDFIWNSLSLLLFVPFPLPIVSSSSSDLSQITPEPSLRLPRSVSGIWYSCCVRTCWSSWTGTSQPPVEGSPGPGPQRLNPDDFVLLYILICDSLFFRRPSSCLLFGWRRRRKGIWRVLICFAVRIFFPLHILVPHLHLYKESFQYFRLCVPKLPSTEEVRTSPYDPRMKESVEVNQKSEFTWIRNISKYHVKLLFLSSSSSSHTDCYMFYHQQGAAVLHSALVSPPLASCWVLDFSKEKRDGTPSAAAQTDEVRRMRVYRK